MTLGARGALLHGQGRSALVPAIAAGPVVETTGAGDAFNGGFATGLARGMDPWEAVRFGCATAGHLGDPPGHRPLDAHPRRGRGAAGARLMRPAGLLLALLASAAAAEPPPYRDDRSDPAALVASYYNAVARGEYARAWSYFGDTPPVADYAAFVAGYADTAGVELLTGEVAAEGAAGSIYSTVPVALAATAPDGGVRVFAGCYLVRQVQPALQEPPFRPLFIEKARLQPAAGPLAAALPESCAPFD